MEINYLESHFSGRTVSRWCKENGIYEQTYYMYQNKIRELERDKIHQLTYACCGHTGYSYHYINNAIIEVNEVISQNMIMVVLSALQSICGAILQLLKTFILHVNTLLQTLQKRRKYYYLKYY